MNKDQKTPDNTKISALEGAMQQVAGELINDVTNNICKYVNIVAGACIIAQPDNVIRRMLLELLLDYEDRKNDAS